MSAAVRQKWVWVVQNTTAYGYDLERMKIFLPGSSNFFFYDDGPNKRILQLAIFVKEVLQKFTLNR